MEHQSIIECWQTHHIAFGGVFRHQDKDEEVFIENDPLMMKKLYGRIYGRKMNSQSSYVSPLDEILDADLSVWIFVSAIRINHQ